MLRLITGVPGAGKTLFAVSEILKAKEENDVLEKNGEKPRPIFTNIDGMEMEGVYPLDDLDWRTYPDGSLIVYDEAHQTFRATGKPGLSGDPVISGMDVHRHRGFDLWFITQFPSKVHHEIRHMVDEHYHLLRQFGAKQATIYKWPESADVKDYHSRKEADTSFFRYPKKCFQYYKSASVHTAKLRIPAKIKFLVTIIALVLSVVAYRVVDAGGFASLNAAPLAPVVVGGADGGAAERPVDPHASSSNYQTLGGCVSSQRGCQCYTPALEPIPLQDHECRNLSIQPLAMGLKINTK